MTELGPEPRSADSWACCLLSLLASTKESRPDLYFPQPAQVEGVMGSEQASGQAAGGRRVQMTQLYFRAGEEVTAHLV